MLIFFFVKDNFILYLVKRYILLLVCSEHAYYFLFSLLLFSLDDAAQYLAAFLF